MRWTKREWIGAAALLATGALAAPGETQPIHDTPAGWFVGGDRSHAYTSGLDRERRHVGEAAAILRSGDKPTGGFGSLMQTFSAARYRGERIRFSAWIDAEIASDGWAGLWMRIDGKAHADRALVFDNMQKRRIVGDQRWTRHAVVLDVPDDAHAIALGVLLVEQGEVRIDGVTFEVVDESVPVTAMPRPAARLEPYNLSFEETP
jgi:hypothetical protein